MLDLRDEIASIAEQVEEAKGQREHADDAVGASSPPRPRKGCNVSLHNVQHLVVVAQVPPPIRQKPDPLGGRATRAGHAG